MVRKYDEHVRVPGLCNLWGCNIEEVQALGGVTAGRTARGTRTGMRLKRCTRCKEVVYCSEQHQVGIVINM
jgi:hypothetical protein